MYVTSIIWVDLKFESELSYLQICYLLDDTVIGLISYQYC